MEQATQVAPAVTTQDHIELWCHWMGNRGLSPNTIRLYRRTIEQAALELPSLPLATEEQLQAWIDAQGGKPGTVSNRISALTSYFKYLKKMKIRTTDNPALELDRPKIPKRVPKPIKDIETVLKALDESDVLANERGPVPRRVGETRDLAVFLFYTGLRIHEAVKFDAPVPCPEEWAVVGKGNKEEVVLLREEAREAWDRLGGKWPIGARATQRRFEKVTTERVTPHMWRHSLATMLVRGGVEIGRVSKIMRHSSPAITMGYAAYAKEQNRQALSVLKGYSSSYMPE